MEGFARSTWCLSTCIAPEDRLQYGRRTVGARDYAPVLETHPNTMVKQEVCDSADILDCCIQKKKFVSSPLNNFFSKWPHSKGHTVNHFHRECSSILLDKLNSVISSPSLQALVVHHRIPVKHNP